MAVRGERHAAGVCVVASTFKSVAVSSEYAATFLSNPANYLIVAEAEDEIAGFVLAYRLDRLDRVARELFVYEVDVAPNYRRRGIGTSLMAFVRQIVATEHVMEAFVVAEEANDPALAAVEARAVWPPRCMFYRRTAAGHSRPDAIHPDGRSRWQVLRSRSGCLIPTLRSAGR